MRIRDTGHPVPLLPVLPLPHEVGQVCHFETDNLIVDPLPTESDTPINDRKPASINIF
jgi:hypothetical protein